MEGEREREYQKLHIEREGKRTKTAIFTDNVWTARCVHFAMPYESMGLPMHIARVVASLIRGLVSASAQLGACSYAAIISYRF